MVVTYVVERVCGVVVLRVVGLHVERHSYVQQFCDVGVQKSRHGAFYRS